MALQLAEGESILRQNIGSYKGKGFFGTKNGTFYLTNKRLIFATASKGLSFLIGAAGAQFIPGSRVEWEIPLGDITALGFEKYGLGKWSCVTAKGEKYLCGFMSNDWIHSYIKDAITALGKSVIADGENYKVE